MCTPDQILFFTLNARAGEYEQLVTKLANKPSLLNKQDHYGQTALFAACENNQLDILHYLLQQNAATDITSNNGYAAIHIACRSGLQPIVEALLTHDPSLANPTSNPKGWTPLHFTAKLNNPELTRLLVLNGADTTIKNDHGQTPLALTTNEEVQTILASQESLLGIINAVSAQNLVESSRDIKSTSHSSSPHL